jgi:hypothetical protein
MIERRVYAPVRCGLAAAFSAKAKSVFPAGDREKLRKPKPARSI